MKILCLCFACILCTGCIAVPQDAENSNSNSMQKKTIQQTNKQIVPFAPTFHSTEKDPYRDAVKIYESSQKAEQGVYLSDHLIFVIVCIDTSREHIKYLEGTAMLRTVALLREKYPELPPKFRVQNRIVEKELNDDTGIYRYVSVYRESDILKMCKTK